MGDQCNNLLGDKKLVILLTFAYYVQYKKLFDGAGVVWKSDLFKNFKNTTIIIILMQYLVYICDFEMLLSVRLVDGFNQCYI